MFKDQRLFDSAIDMCKCFKFGDELRFVVDSILSELYANDREVSEIIDLRDYDLDESANFQRTRKYSELLENSDYITINAEKDSELDKHITSNTNVETKLVDHEEPVEIIDVDDLSEPTFEIDDKKTGVHSRLFHFTASGGKARIIANVD